jgi:hypothetical protein
MYLAEYLEIRLFWSDCFGSAGILGRAAGCPEASVTRPALRTTLLEASTTLSTDESRAFNLFFSLGNSIAPPLTVTGGGRRATESTMKPGQVIVRRLLRRSDYNSFTGDVKVSDGSVINCERFY